jgi:uncharacterized protein (TIGR02266 family)
MTSKCKNLYAFIRFRLGGAVSDREIARRWGMEWKSFAALKHGRRQVPRIAELEELARLLKLDVPLVFEVARGTPAATMHRLLDRNDREKLSQLLMAGVLAVHRDAESKEVRHEAILNRVNDAIFTVDVQGRFQDVNGRLCALSGYTARELLERTLFDLLTSDERAKFVQTAAEVYAAGEVRQAVFGARTKTGEMLRLELGLSRIDDKRGHAVGMQGIARDVSDRFRLEEELRQQNATLRLTFESTPAASMLFGKDGTILLANPLVENVCEWTSDEIVGKNAFDVFGNPGPIGCPVTRAFQTGKLEQQISVMQNRLGEKVFVHRTAGPVLGADGRTVEKVVEILVDVTEQVEGGDPRVLALWSKDPSDRTPDIEKRQFVRVPLEAAVRLTFGKKRSEGIAFNLGRGGIFLQTRDLAPLAAPVALEWGLPRRRQPIRAKGVVVWRGNGSRGLPAGMGIKFSDVDHPSRRAVAKFLAETVSRVAVFRPRAPVAQ